MHTIFKQHKEFWQDRRMVRAIVVWFLMLGVSLIVNYYIGGYVNISASNSVTDIVLSNTRAYDVDAMFVYGAFLYFVFIVVYCIRRPFQAPYIMKSIALFILIRCVFVSITHIWPFPIRSMMAANTDILSIFSKFSFTSDLFFSGHTGLPFLMALIFWREKYLRILFIASSVFFGIVVLLAHLHYSIDVLSAFFITYTIHHMNKTFFKKDFSLSEKVLEV